MENTCVFTCPVPLLSQQTVHFKIEVTYDDASHPAVQFLQYKNQDFLGIAALFSFPMATFICTLFSFNFTNEYFNNACTQK